MSFIRTKQLGKEGHKNTYYYLVESKRDKKTGNVKQKVLKYYGREKPKGYKPKPKKKKEEKPKKKLGTTEEEKRIDRLNEIEKMIINKEITEENWRNISDEVYEMVEIKLETEPSYEQTRNDRYGRLKRALRKAKKEEWEKAIEILEEK